MTKYKFHLSFIWALVALMSLVSFVFSGCSGGGDSKLKQELAEKDTQISTLTQQLEFYTSENDSYTTESGHILTIEGGKIASVDDTIITIKTLEGKSGFSVWKKDGKVFSGENTIKISIDTIEENATYTALYNCVGIMAVKEGNLSIEKAVKPLGEFNYSSLLKACYEFAPNNANQKSTYKIIGNDITYTSSIFSCDEFDKNEVLNCYTASIANSQVSFFKIFLPDNVDPYNVISNELGDDVPLFNESGEQQRTFKNDDALIYWMNTQDVGTKVNASVCVSLTNQKEGSEAESTKVSILLTR